MNERETIPHRDFKKIWARRRPDEALLDDYYDELAAIWDGVFETLPELRRPATEMRIHNPADGDADADVRDHALFWPIGQYVFAKIVRQLLDDYSTQISKDVLDVAEVVEALAPLRFVEWSLHRAPWRHLLLVQVRDKASALSWAMRNEERAAAIRAAREVLEFIVGLNPLDEESQQALQQRWTDRLLPPPSDEDAERMWQEVLEQATSAH